MVYRQEPARDAAVPGEVRIHSVHRCKQARTAGIKASTEPLAIGHQQNHQYLPQLPGLPATEAYADVEGFCKSATRDEIKSQGFVLTPGRYVGTPEGVADALTPTQRYAQLSAELLEELDRSTTIEAQLRELLGRVNSDD